MVKMRRLEATVGSSNKLLEGESLVAGRVERTPERVVETPVHLSVSHAGSVEERSVRERGSERERESA